MKKEIVTGELLDDVTLTIDQLAEACRVEKQWIVERVEAGIIKNKHPSREGHWCFISEDLARARRLLFIEKSFDADAELAALVTDLIEEVNQLKQQLRVFNASDNQ